MEDLVQLFEVDCKKYKIQLNLNNLTLDEKKDEVIQLKRYIKNL